MKKLAYSIIVISFLVSIFLPYSSIKVNAYEPEFFIDSAMPILDSSDQVKLSDKKFDSFIKPNISEINSEYLNLKLEPNQLEYELESVNTHATDNRAYTPPSLEIIQQTQEDVKGFDCSTVIDVPVIECEALVALYESTNGAGWLNNSNWLFTTTVGDWYGVEVAFGHVYRLRFTDIHGNIRFNNLVGTIPKELENLSKLYLLNLSNNYLTGEIPPELGNLIELRFIYLDTPSGIPGEGLSGPIPQELGNLINVIEINFSQNALIGEIPSSLGNLLNLKSLSLFDNKLTGNLPPELSKIKYLEKLNVSSNYLSGELPIELENLLYLKELNLGNNLYSGVIPEIIIEFQNLSSLNLSNNKFDGTLPSWLGNLSELYLLNVSGNNFVGELPFDISNLSKLKWLYINDNGFSGSIPLSFTKLSDLYLFKFSGTYLCEPDDLAFLDWKETVREWIGSGITCGSSTNQVDLDVKNSKVRLSPKENQSKQNQPNSTLIEIDVFNKSSNIATDVLVQFFDSDPTNGKIIASKLISEIPSYSSKTVQSNWNSYISPASVDIFAKVSSHESDFNLENNITSIPTKAYIAFVDYSYDPDTFSFQNFGLSWSYFTSELYYYSTLRSLFGLSQFLYLIVPNLYFFMGSGGNCYGMSATSILYWETPSIKPIQKDTFDFTKSEVEYDIQKFHVRQLLRDAPILLTGEYFPSFDLVSPSKAYNQVKERLVLETNPSILDLKQDYDSNWGHAVVAYKVVEIGGKKNIFYYDNNFPLTTIEEYSPDILVLNEADNSFYLDKYDVTIQVATSTNPVRSEAEITTELLEDIVDLTLKLLSEDGLLQGYFSWGNTIFDPFSSSNLPIAQDVIPNDAPNYFVITDEFGNRIGYNEEGLLNEIPNADFRVFDSSFYWLLPDENTYTLETEGNGTEDAVLSFAVPLDNTQIQEIIYQDFSLQVNSLVQTTFGNEMTDWRITIENQPDVIPFINDIITTQYQIMLPVLFK